MDQDDGTRGKSWADREAVGALSDFVRIGLQFGGPICVDDALERPEAAVFDISGACFQQAGALTSKTGDMAD